MKRISSQSIFAEKFGARIETFETFQRAIAGLSETTVGHYKQVLPSYFLFLGQTPDEVIEQRQKDIESVNFGDNENYERLTRTYLKMKIDANQDIHSDMSRILGFFSNNGKKYALDINTKKMKIPKARKTDKFAPSIVEVKKLYDVGDTRDKLIIAIMSQHGASPMDVSQIKIGKYPKNAWEYFEFSRHKTGEIWRGISTPDVCELMRVYLLTRGGQEGDPLFVGREGVLDSGGISQVVSELIKKAQLGDIEGFVPKSLRDFFEDALTDANINYKVKETLMGRTSDVQHVYGSTKRMKERLTEAEQKLYAQISLANNSLAAAPTWYSAEDKAFFDKLLANKEKLEKALKLAELAEKGLLVHVDDLPESRVA